MSGSEVPPGSSDVEDVTGIASSSSQPAFFGEIDAAQKAYDSLLNSKVELDAEYVKEISKISDYQNKIRDYQDKICDCGNEICEYAKDTGQLQYLVKTYSPDVCKAMCEKASPGSTLSKCTDVTLNSDYILFRENTLTVMKENLAGMKENLAGMKKSLERQREGLKEAVSRLHKKARTEQGTVS